MISRPSLQAGRYGAVLLTTLLLITLFSASQASAPAQKPSGAGTSQFLPLIMVNVPGGLGSVTGQVVDARDGFPIDGAEVCSALGTCVIADEDGFYTISGIPPGLRLFTASAGGYDSLTLPKLIVGQSTVELDFALSDFLEFGQYRIVVIWGDGPADLDAHLWTPQDIPYDDDNNGTIEYPEEHRPHVFQGHRGYCQATPDFPQTNACLDKDDRDGNGPETITILETGDGHYHYAVQRFEPACFEPGNPSPVPCPTPLEASGARVQVYDASGLRLNITVPTSNPENKFYWYVFELDYDIIQGEQDLIIHNCLTDRHPTDIDLPPTCPE